ncbi:MAG: hypothetical protein JSW00_17195 [Thermoplasmata archaeon]|nr:MAG: hypothetical protein JSW00_17195 [Thermoplasmata archaeon]
MAKKKASKIIEEWLEGTEFDSRETLDIGGLLFFPEDIYNELKSENKIIRETNKRLNEENEKLKEKIIDLEKKHNIEGLKKQLKGKDMKFSKLNTDYNKLREKLESQIEDLKIKLSGKESEIKHLTREVKRYKMDKEEWFTRYQSNLPQWSLESLEDKKYSFYASWVNPYSRKTEGKYIPKDFNPHHKNRIERDKRDYYTIYYKVGNKNRRIRLHKSLFEKLKDEIEPRKKKTFQVQSPIDIEKKDLIKVDNLNQIKKIYAEKGKASMITDKMEKIANHFFDNRGIPISTGEVKSIAKCDQKTINRHLNFMKDFGIIEKLSHGQWRMPD